MAITLSVAITGASDNPVFLSADPGNARAIKIDNEQMLVVAHASGVTRTPFQPDGQTAGSGAYGNAVVSVQRAWNGTDGAPHAAGASVTPLFEALTATAGTLV